MWDQPGSYRAVAVDGAAPVSSSTGYNWPSFTNMNLGHCADSGFEGTIIVEYWHIFDRLLLDAEILSLHHAPYAQSAVRAKYFYSAAEEEAQTHWGFIG